MQEPRVLSETMSRLESATELDPLVDRATDVVDVAIRGDLRDALSGVPAGHRIHPAVILLPVGAFISSAILDFVPGAAKFSKLLVGVGILGVLPAVATGWTDWASLGRRQKRVGIVHSASNAAATSLYAASFLLRGRGKQRAGVVTGLLGLAFVGASGYLGGHLAYREAALDDRLQKEPVVGALGSDGAEASEVGGAADAPDAGGPAGVRDAGSLE